MWLFVVVNNFFSILFSGLRFYINAILLNGASDSADVAHRYVDYFNAYVEYSQVLEAVQPKTVIFQNQLGCAAECMVILVVVTVLVVRHLKSKGFSWLLV